MATNRTWPGVCRPTVWSASAVADEIDGVDYFSRKEFAMKNYFGSSTMATVWGVALMLVFCFSVAGCSLFSSIGSEKDKKELFKSRDQYVRIARQESAKGVKVPPNEHPVSLDEDQIRTALGSLEFMLPKENKSAPVFERPELEVLGRSISSALAEAGPDEDVVFAVVGDYKSLYGLAKEQKYTAGRVFYREGKLNIIFGEIHGKYWATADRRLYPLAPGSRFKATEHVWMLIGQPDQEFHSGQDGQRTDWVVLDLASMEARAAMGEKAAQAKGSGGSGGGQAQPQLSAEKTVEERLTILNELKNKKLITEEEYQKKRADILKDL